MSTVNSEQPSAPAVTICPANKSQQGSLAAGAQTLFPAPKDLDYFYAYIGHSYPFVHEEKRYDLKVLRVNEPRVVQTLNDEGLATTKQRSAQVVFASGKGQEWEVPIDEIEDVSNKYKAIKYHGPNGKDLWSFKFEDNTVDVYSRTQCWQEVIDTLHDPQWQPKAMHPSHEGLWTVPGVDPRKLKVSQQGYTPDDSGIVAYLQSEEFAFNSKQEIVKVGKVLKFTQLDIKQAEKTADGTTAEGIAYHLDPAWLQHAEHHHGYFRSHPVTGERDDEEAKEIHMALGLVPELPKSDPKLQGKDSCAIHAMLKAVQLRMGSEKMDCDCVDNIKTGTLFKDYYDTLTDGNEKKEFEMTANTPKRVQDLSIANVGNLFYNCDEIKQQFQAHLDPTFEKAMLSAKRGAGALVGKSLENMFNVLKTRPGVYLHEVISNHVVVYDTTDTNNPLIWETHPTFTQAIPFTLPHLQLLSKGEGADQIMMLREVHVKCKDDPDGEDDYIKGSDNREAECVQKQNEWLKQQLDRKQEEAIRVRKQQEAKQQEEARKKAAEAAAAAQREMKLTAAAAAAAAAQTMQADVSVDDGSSGGSSSGSSSSSSNASTNTTNTTITSSGRATKPTERYKAGPAGGKGKGKGDDDDDDDDEREEEVQEVEKSEPWKKLKSNLNRQFNLDRHAHMMVSDEPRFAEVYAKDHPKGSITAKAFCVEYDDQDGAMGFIAVVAQPNNRKHMLYDKFGYNGVGDDGQKAMKTHMGVVHPTYDGLNRQHNMPFVQRVVTKVQRDEHGKATKTGLNSPACELLKAVASSCGKLGYCVMLTTAISKAESGHPFQNPRYGGVMCCYYSSDDYHYYLLNAKVKHPNGGDCIDVSLFDVPTMPNYYGAGSPSEKKQSVFFTIGQAQAAIDKHNWTSVVTDIEAISQTDLHYKLKARVCEVFFKPKPKTQKRLRFESKGKGKGSKKAKTGDDQSDL